ncbi:MAG: helix-turn-helix domain-containing protein, partial [Clostridia bacterium]|nr:helix-turn-helix domain-containing protein [Clostridia bacterium]
AKTESSLRTMRKLRKLTQEQLALLSGVNVRSIRSYEQGDNDILKAGVRQSDGCYYFFNQDPIYLEAPKVEGYKLLGFYNKANGKLEINPILQKIDGGMYLPRYSMDNKNVELEARYQKWSYQISFDTMAEGDVNPNVITEYCFVDDGNVTLAPATTTNTHKTFVGWAYQDTQNAGGSQADWIKLEKSGDNYKLPSDYYEEYMRIAAFWENDKYTIDFAFELYVDPSTSEPLSFEEACEALSVKGNLATVDGVPVKCDSPDDRTPVTKNSELKMEYGSWLEIFPTVTSQYNIFYCKVNGERKDLSIDYFLLSSGEITEDTTITIVLSLKIA